MTEACKRAGSRNKRMPPTIYGGSLRLARGNTKFADPADLLRALVGFAYVNSAPDWEPSARRLIDLLINR